MFCRHLLRDHGRALTNPLRTVLSRAMSDNSWAKDTISSTPDTSTISNIPEIISAESVPHITPAVQDTVPVSQLSSSSEVIKVAVEQLPDLVWWSPPSYIIHGLDLLHTTTGLPWWATLACSGVMFRCAMLPLNIQTQKVRLKFLSVAPEFNKNVDATRTAVQTKDAVKLKVLQSEKKYLISKHGVSQLSMFKPMMGVVACTSMMFISITSLTNMPYAPLMTTDFLWLTNLTVSDPYHAMAAFNGMLIAAVMRSGLEAGGKNPVMDMFFSTNLRTVSFIMFMGVTQGYFSAALLTYWTSSNLVGLCTVPLLKNDKFRNVVGLMPMSEARILEAQQPSLQDILDKASGAKTVVREEGREAEMLKHRARAEELAKQALLANEEYLKSVEQYEKGKSDAGWAKAKDIVNAECVESGGDGKADLRVNCKLAEEDTAEDDVENWVKSHKNM